MLRKKEFDSHLRSLEDALDQDDDEEWESELNAQREPDTNIEDLNADEVRPPAYGHTDGERVVGTTNKSSFLRHEAPFRESLWQALEDRLCALMESDSIKNVNHAGGAVPSISPITPVGTANKKQVNDADEEGKPDSKDLRAKSKPSIDYNLNRGSDSEDSDSEATGEIESAL